MNSITDTKSPLFDNRKLASMTIPLVMSSLLTIITNIVDSIMVSSAGAAAVSAVSLVGSVTLIFIMLISAATSGGVVVTSQYIGSGDMEKANESAKQLLYLALFAGLILTAILAPFRTPILKFVYGGVEADVFKNAEDYLLWLAFGYPFFAIGTACTAILRSIGKSTTSVVLTICMNIFNVIGNAILIYGFKLGAAGAAMATSISRVFFAIIGLVILHNKSLKIHFSRILCYRPDLKVIKTIMIIGGSSGISSGLFYVGKLLVSTLMATLGTVAIASYSVAFSICNFGWAASDGASVAIVPIVGQCIGAGRRDEARLNAKKVSNFATVCIFVIFGLIAIFSKWLVPMYDLEANVLSEAAKYTTIGALLTIFSFYSWAFLPISAFRAAGDVKYGMVVSIITMFVFRVGLAYLLCLVFDFGLLGIWLGMWADWIVRAILNFIHFRQGKWLDKKVI